MFGKKKKNVEKEDRIIVDSNMFSDKVEGYNRLRDNIMYLNADNDRKVIQIESSVAHEGKTTVVTNLAVSLGLVDKKVIVIDLDFRKPKVHRRFHLKSENGVSDFMLDKITLKEAIKKTKYKNVDVITRGSKVYNSAVILTSEKFRNFVKDLRETYDYVLLDCAPVLQVSDFIHILQVSDGVLFLVAYGMTTKSQVSEAISELRKNNANILGSIFSMYDAKKDKGYYGYHSGYYGKGYYGKGYYSYYSTGKNDKDFAEEETETENVEDKEVKAEEINSADKKSSKKSK